MAYQYHANDPVFLLKIIIEDGVFKYELEYYFETYVRLHLSVCAPIALIDHPISVVHFIQPVIQKLLCLLWIMVFFFEIMLFIRYIFVFRLNDEVRIVWI